MKKNILKLLQEEISKIAIIDTHEHIRDFKELQEENMNLFKSFRYALVHLDLISAGMPREEWQAIEKTCDLKQGWKKIKPYLYNVRGTSFYRSILPAYRDLFNFHDEEITDDNWIKLSDNITEAYEKENWYEYVLKKKSRISTAILDDGWKAGNTVVDRRFFIPTLRLDPFYYWMSDRFVLNSKYLLDKIIEKWGVQVDNFEDYLELIDLAFKKVKNGGGCTVKIAVAYTRALEFDNVTEREARRVFNMSHEKISPSDAKKFEDFVMVEILRKCIEYRFPLQVHTGMHYYRGMGMLQGTNPSKLQNMIKMFPEVKFVIFHGGYPYSGEAGVLAKIYPNVYLDFCWLPFLLSPEMAKRCLNDWIGFVPTNKITYGGDTECVERCYSAILSAKQLVSKVLADKVASGYFSYEIALDIAKKIFRENALRMYQISNEN